MLMQMVPRLRLVQYIDFTEGRYSIGKHTIQSGPRQYMSHRDRCCSAAVETHKGRDEERFDLVDEGVPKTPRAQAKSCNE